MHCESYPSQKLHKHGLNLFNNMRNCSETIDLIIDFIIIKSMSETDNFYSQQNMNDVDIDL